MAVALARLLPRTLAASTEPVLEDRGVLRGVLVPLGTVRLTCVLRGNAIAAHGVLSDRHWPYVVRVAARGRVAHEMVQMQPLGLRAVLAGVGVLVSPDRAGAFQPESSIPGIEVTRSPKVATRVRFGYPLLIEALVNGARLRCHLCTVPEKR